MNTIQFSLKRTTDLFLTYFAGGWRKDLRNCSVLFALTAILATSIWFEFSLFFFFLLYSVDVARTFSYLGNKTKRFDYLMIPASIFEKFLANIFIVHIYKYLLYAVAFIIGKIVGVSIIAPLFSSFGLSHNCNVILTDVNEIFYPFFYIRTLLFLIFTQSILLFGSIYFKKSALIKTALVLFAFSAVFTIGYTILFQSFSGTVDIYGNSLEYYFNEMSRGGNASKAGNVAGYVVIICSTLYFWTLSYLRLRETEV